jgi:hypothetical protein
VLGLGTRRNEDPKPLLWTETADEILDHLAEHLK